MSTRAREGSPTRPARDEDRANAARAPETRQDLHELQRSVGNRGVVSAAGAVGRLVVGAANDVAEVEADRAADEVLARLGRPAPAATAQRAATPLDGAVVGVEGGAVDATTESAITSARGGGRALDEPVRREMEDAFGADFGGVRVHTGPTATVLNRRISARAFTTGSDIFFADGEFAPDTAAGKRTLAHELAHTIQQGSSAQRSVHRQTALIQRKHDPASIDWAGATAVIPSAEGALGGVVFMTVAGVQYVIKPGEGSAANALFAEDVLGLVGGAQTTESAPVLQADAAFQLIHDRIRTESDSCLDPSQTDATKTKYRERWQRNWPYFDNAAYYMVQKSMKSADLGGAKNQGADNKDFSEAYKTDPLSILEDTAYLENVGRALVADMLLGNADRLEQVNGGNFFVLGNSKLGAIDNEAFFPSEAEFEKYAKSDRGMTFADGSMTAQWVSYLVGSKEGSAVHKEAPVASPANVMGDIESWVRNRFANLFMGGYDDAAAQRKQNLKQAGYDEVKSGRQDQQAQMNQNWKSPKWQAVYQAIYRGYKDGLKRLQDNLKGKKGDALRARFHELEEQYGQDKVGMDFTAFEVRAAYMDAVASGKKPKDAEKAALAKANGYLHEDVRRVLDSGVTYGSLTGDMRGKIMDVLADMTPKQQKALVHVRSGLRKLLSSKDDERFERLRVELLKEFLAAFQAETAAGYKPPATTAAYAAAVKEAEDIEKLYSGTGITGEGGYESAMWNRHNLPAFAKA